MGDGMINTGRSASQLGETLMQIAARRSQPEAVDRQELLQAQQHFRTRFNEWQADNATTRFDQIEDQYDAFATGYQQEMTGNEEFFTSDTTAEAFDFWLGEQISALYLPIQSGAAQQKFAYHEGLYNANLENAIAAQDMQSVYTAVGAALEQGVITVPEGQTALEDAIYDINYQKVEGAILSQAREIGWEAAAAQLDSLTPEALQFQVDEDEDGNPVYRQFSQDDVDGIKERVREELEDQRREQQYTVDRVDTAFDEAANQLFTTNSLGDLIAFKRWLEGTNPANGEALPDTTDPATGNPRSGMKSGTWRTWYNAVNGAISRIESDMDADEQAANEQAARDWAIEHLRMVENDPSSRLLNEHVLQGLELGAVDPDKARTLIQYNEARDENPVFDGIQNQINAQIEGLDLPEDVEIDLKTDAQDEYLKWFNQETVQRSSTGQWAYNIDTADRDTQQKIARNIVYSVAGPQITETTRAAWAIREGEIMPANARSGLSRDVGNIDEAEQILAAVQRDEYLGWPALNAGVQNQLITLWHGHSRLFEEIGELAPVNEEQLDDRGRPILAQYDENGNLRYFRFRIPTDEEGQLTGGFWQGGIPGAVAAEANEILQVYDPASGLYYDATLRPNRTGTGVRVIMRNDQKGWAP